MWQSDYAHTHLPDIITQIHLHRLNVKKADYGGYSLGFGNAWFQQKRKFWCWSWIP